MDMEEGAMVEPVAVACQITKVGNVKANQQIVVFWLRSHRLTLTSCQQGIWGQDSNWRGY